MKRKPEAGAAKGGRPEPGATPRKTDFPGGPSSGVVPVLRVAFERAAMSDLIAHGAATSEVEVGGVLVGYLGEDADGHFVHVEAVIRAEQAREQGAHVTFTHETWNHIHGEMDSRHRGREIVGWYHTHPGFGVFLSEMDTFIHENFFSQPHHVAAVYDPLSGALCMCVLRDGALTRLDRYWRDGREIALRSDSSGAASAPTEDLAGLRESIRRMENQLVAGPPSRGWIEEWLTPGLLLAILALAINAWFMDRESERTQLKAEMFERIQMLSEQGQIRIIDAVTGAPIGIGRGDGRAEVGPTRPAPPGPTSPARPAPRQP